MVWSPDSHYIYSAEMNGNRLWRVDVAAERLEEKTRPSGRFAGDMAANSAGQLVIREGAVIKDAEAGRSTDNGAVTLFDWATGKQRPISRRYIHFITFGQDPSLFVGFEEDSEIGGMMCVGALKKGGNCRIIRLGRSTATTVFALSPDSTHLAYAPEEGGLKVLDLTPYKQAAASRPGYLHGAPGAAVFVRLTDAGDDARSDAYEQRLAGGTTKLLISHTALPKSFRGRIARSLPSSDGGLILLQASDGGGWLWSRRTGIVRKITLFGTQESLLDLRHTSLDWPMEWRGKLLLLRVHTEINRPTEKILSESIRIFNGATSRTRTIYTLPEDDMLFAGWAGNGKAVLVGERVGKNSSRLALVSLTGQERRLVTVSSDVFTAAISPDGRQLATADSSGYLSLFRRDRGRKDFSRVARLKLGIPEDSDEFMGDMTFSPDGRALALRISCSYGTMHDAFWERLWTVQTKSETVQQVAPSIAYDEDGKHVLLGWVPGQSALFLISQGSLGAEGEYRKLWLQPVNPAQPARLLANTGPRGIGLAWWGGQGEGK